MVSLLFILRCSGLYRSQFSQKSLLIVGEHLLITFKLLQLSFHQKHELLSFANLLLKFRQTDVVLFIEVNSVLKVKSFPFHFVIEIGCVLLDFHHFTLQHPFEVVLSFLQFLVIFPFKSNLHRIIFTFYL